MNSFINILPGQLTDFELEEMKKATGPSEFKYGNPISVEKCSILYFNFF